MSGFKTNASRRMLMLPLMCAAVLCTLALTLNLGTTKAYADSAPDTVTVHNRALYPSWTGMNDGISIAAHTATDENGNPLFCCAFHKKYPPEGETLSKSYWHSYVLDYIIYYGYGGDGYKNNGSTLNGYSGIAASAITQIAVWYVCDGLNDTYAYTKYADAALSFYNEAKANASSSAIYAHTAYVYDDGTNQPLIAQVVHSVPVKVHKVIANSNTCTNATYIVTNNNTYSLNGTEYTIYTDAECHNVAHDESTGAECVLTINNAETLQGWTGTVNLNPNQTYYLKETKATAGMALDPTRYTIAVASGQVSNGAYIMDVQDVLDVDPLSIRYGKSLGSDAENDAGRRE